NEVNLCSNVADTTRAAAANMADVLQRPAVQSEVVLLRSAVAWMSASIPNTQVLDCQLTPICPPPPKSFMSKLASPAKKKALFALLEIFMVVADRPQLYPIFTPI